MLSSFSSPIPGRSTLPSPSGQPSPSSSRLFDDVAACRGVAKPYIPSRNASSPVQRQISATALGNFDVSSVLPGSSLAPK